jgi:hypothetical protein
MFGGRAYGAGPQLHKRCPRHTPTGGCEELSPEIGAMAQLQMIGATQAQPAKRPPGG